MLKQPTRNQLRIIGGKWRGRKIHFPDAEGLRPTSDRIRETLFNWLAGWVEGASCVDLFAGSGALGFEAASRGAARVTLVDQAANVVAALKQNKALLNADTVEVKAASAFGILNQLTATDILFLDPPFAIANLDELLVTIEDAKFLAPNAWIYLESAADRAIVTPSTWALHRQKQAGQVAYRLLRRH